MSWRALLKGDPVPWLLERRDPAVRAQTLRSLLDKSPRDPERLRGARPGDRSGHHHLRHGWCVRRGGGERAR